MKWDLSGKALSSDFRRRVEEISGQNLSDCYQCGRCSAGCPVLADVEMSPNRVVRLVQLGLDDAVFASETIWSCTACGTCNGRCPMGVDMVAIMDALRMLAQREGNLHGVSEVWTFYRAFLDCIREFGRLNEIALMGGYNVNSGRIFTNVVKAPWFFMKGKVALSPHTVKRIDRLQRVFKRIEELEAE
jgi:heterodisulfide reductase subunit C